ncbi:MAG: hypothetical protein AB4911_12835 [Oscillochloridaceae bacterium umkhey_bin13]
MEYYNCPRELLPVIESALAAEGYLVALPLQRAVGAIRITVMTCGTAIVALHEDRAQAIAQITVYRNEETSQLAILDELPRLIAPSVASRRTRR